MVMSESPDCESNEVVWKPVLPGWVSDDVRKQIVDLCFEQDGKFIEKLAKYLDSFMGRYPEAAKPLLKGGVIAGKKHQESIGLGGGPILDGIWLNAGMHNLAVGIIAEIIAKKIGLDEERTKKVVLAACIHNWFIAYERRAMNYYMQSNYHFLKAEDDDERDVLVYQEMQRLRAADINQLKKMGIDEDAANLTMATRLWHDNKPIQSEDITAEQAIIFAVEAFMKGTSPMALDKEARLTDNSLWNRFYRGSKQAYGNKTFIEHAQAVIPKTNQILKPAEIDLNSPQLPQRIKELFVEEVNEVAA